MPEDHECISAIQSYRMGSIRQHKYPDPICSWLKTSSSTVKISHISDKTVSYDPYYDRSVSEIFPTGFCSARMCKTVNTGQLWYTDYNKRPKCLADSLEPIYFYLKYYSETLIGLWSPDMIIPVGHKLCSKNFCGMPSVLFPDGSWIGIKPAELIGQRRAGDFLKNITTCHETTRPH